ncbi:hypothetical protein ACFV4P_25340 [Kitasatospora sp. NPDC059795]|uniref:hypothetical protein n=1 Tax=Kitasatospora sp. NPDC059795 TaxID=3346949 RepID=UPI00364F5F5D
MPLTLSTRIDVTLSELAKPKDTSVEARYETGHVSLSVFRLDDDMIVTRRTQDDGVFDRFAGHVEDLWGRGHDVWTIRTRRRPTASSLRRASWPSRPCQVQDGPRVAWTSPKALRMPAPDTGVVSGEWQFRTRPRGPGPESGP